MAGESFITGDNIILSIYDGTGYLPVACLTSNSISSQRSTIDVITKCEPGVTVRTLGIFDYSISADGLSMDTGTGGDTTKFSYGRLFDLQQGAGALVEWSLTTGETTITERYGSAVLSDLNQDAPTAGENSTFSLSLTGSGAVVSVNPNP